MLKSWSWIVWRLARPSRTNTQKKNVFFIIGDWNSKLGSQDIPGITGKFGLGVQNEAGQRLKEFCQENALVVANTLFKQQKRSRTYRHHQMVNTEITLIKCLLPKKKLYSVQFSSVAQSCPTLCNPMNRSTPGLPVHHQLLEFTQTHFHWVSDPIQPSHPWSSPSRPAPNPSQHQSLFQWVNASHEVAKGLELQL